ncbi:MAG: alpha/beta hydrolase [Micromonosporaceae bacterium]
MTAQPIRANSILPGRREPITLHTGDGLALVGELALPETRDPVATLVCLHPLPTHGGMMDSHVFRKAAWRLPALADVAVLRFNTRGTSSVQGTSEGVFDGGDSERYDVAAAIEYAEYADLPRIWLLAWSFGTDLALMYGCDPGVEGAILLSPPLRHATPEHLATWADSGKPVIALVPEFDDYLRPEEAKSRFAAIGQAEVVGVDGAKHLWVGDAETVLDAVVNRVLGAGPLPRTWDGPMAYGDASAYADRTVAAFDDVPRSD